MQLATALQFDVLRRARLVAGSAGLSRDVRWVHVVDLPDPTAWVRPGMLLLTTGYAWPRADEALRELARALAASEIAAIGLAVPQFFERFPAVMHEEAELAGLPLIEIPWEIPFAQIAEELLQALVVDQYRLIERSEAVHRALTRAALQAESLHDIAAALGALIDRAVTIEDAEGRLLAAHRLPELEDDLRRATLAQGSTPGKYEQALAELGYLRAIELSEGPLHIPALPQLGARGRVVCPIRLKRKLVGRAWIIEGSRPLSEIDLRAAEQAALIAALHILHQREIETHNARVGYAFLDSLLAGDFVLTPQAVERAGLLGFNPAGSYHIGLLLLHTALPMTDDGFQRRERLAAALRLSLQRLGVAPLSSLHANQIPFLLPAGSDPAPLWADLAADDVALALSRPHPGLEGLRQAYRETQAMVGLLRPGQCSAYDQLLVPRVLSGDLQARAEFLAQIFGPIRAVRHGADIEASLVAYARGGFRLAHTARGLFIHPKTLAYRLGRAVALTGLDLRDPETRFRLQLAAQLLSIPE